MEELVPDEPELPPEAPSAVVCPEPGCDNLLGPTGCPVHSLGAPPAAGPAAAVPRPTTRDPRPSAPSVVEFPWGPVEVGARAVAIGRDPDCPVAAELEHDRYANVSRRHATLRQDGPLLYVEDLGSTNGTFVNERRISDHEPVLVRPGDSLRFGATLRGVVRGRSR